MSVPDSTAERILQAVRAWLSLAAARTPLTEDQVLIADEPGPRPNGPYLTVKVLADDIPDGADYRLDLLADVVTVAVEDGGGPYEVSVNGTIYSAPGDDAEAVASDLADLINAGDEDLYAVASGVTLTIGGSLASPTTTVGSPLTVETGALPAVVYVGRRSTTVSVQGYGRATLAWLERAFQRINAPEVQALNAAAGVALVPQGGLTDLSSLLDTAFEHRYGRDVVAVYKRYGDPSFAVPVESVVMTATTGAALDLETVTTIETA